MLFEEAHVGKNMISWHMNDACNFECDHCFFGSLKKEHSECGKYSPDHIITCFNDTSTEWIIHMSGGEPFMYPDFIKLCKGLAINHYLSVNTNLSTRNVQLFADQIDPQKVLVINAAVHILEREKVKNRLKNYVENILYFQDRGFYIQASYVSHPALFSRMEEDVKLLKSSGVKNVRVKTFRGVFNGKRYPKFYSESDIGLLKKFGLDSRELNIAHNHIYYFNKLCSHGYKNIVMNIEGDLLRCSSSRKRYGNLFTGDYQFDKKPEPCPIKTCRCPYQGIRGTGEKSGSYFSLVREMAREYLISRLASK